MMLLDAGPMVGVVKFDEPQTSRAFQSFFARRPKKYLTTLAALTEAMYITGRNGGWPMQKALWQFCESYGVRVAGVDARRVERARELMERYDDRPMDFADATMVVAAEASSCRQIVTIDSDFYIYLINGQETFDVINPLA